MKDGGMKESNMVWGCKMIKINRKSGMDFGRMEIKFFGLVMNKKKKYLI